ncbi:MAG TPA: flagellar biosynthetic protein FliO [Planctomycetaceae bacterium]|nr:flagellar biosynthetic protein FliO [Planctomycetaceae bacterium]
MNRLRLLLLICVAVAAVAPTEAQTPPQSLGPFAAETRANPAPIPKPDLRLPERTATNTASQPKSKPSAPTASLWGTVAALGVMALGLMLAVRWLKRHGPPSLRGLPSEAVEPLGQRILSRGVAVHLVRCGSRILLLGVGPDGVRTLSEITDPVEVDLLAGACRRRDETTSGLGAFTQVWQRTNATTSPRTTGRAASSFPSGTLEVDGV